MPPTPEEIIRTHHQAEVVRVHAHPTGYTLRIDEPDPTWQQQYAGIESRTRTALGDRVLAIQHIGSTAVPDLPAKPIIDIDLAVADPVDELANYQRMFRAAGLLD